MSQQRMTIEQALALGLQHHQAGQLGEAERIYQQVLLVNPNQPDALHRLGVVASQVGQFKLAIDLINRAISIKPSVGEFHNDLAQPLIAAGRLIEAATAYRRALEWNPNLPDAHNGLGAILLKEGQPEAAIAEFEEAIRLQPSFAEARNNLATALLEKGQLREAATSYRQAIALKPDYAMAHYNLGLLQLLQGDLENGWREYEWRLRAPELGKVAQAFPQPQWDGSPLNGKHILLHAEQGFGDTIQFARYIPKVAEKGGQIILGCQRELGVLFEGFPGVEKLVLHGEPLPEFDVHCPLLSLPAVFRTTLSTIPASEQYLQVDQRLAAQWTKRVGTERRLKVGLTWAGKANHTNDRRRSMTLNDLAGLANMQEKVCFSSLQKDRISNDADESPLEMIDWTNELHDFADTAALIDQLDLVISVDTAVAHLAAAIGKRVWLMLPFIPDWRWMLEREDSPWYPAIRLFRKNRDSDWSTVAGRVAGELRKLADGA